jgi:HSP20 family protein
VDIFEYDDRYMLFAELPGLSAASIEVHQVGNKVTIRGEKKKPEAAADAVATVRNECRYGQFCRTIELPEGTAADRITAKSNAGILEISVPKTEANKPKTIRVQAEPKPNTQMGV